MSNKRLLQDAPAGPPDEPEPVAQAAADVLRALEQMTAALRDASPQAAPASETSSEERSPPDVAEQGTLRRLRAELTEMRQAIAAARAAGSAYAEPIGPALDLGAVLADLDGRTAAMLDLLAARADLNAEVNAGLDADSPSGARAQQRGQMAAQMSPAPKDAQGDSEAEAQSVPTVTDVVSQLGRASPLEKEETFPSPQDADDTLTPSMLSVLVAELTAPEVGVSSEEGDTQREPEQEPSTAAPDEIPAVRPDADGVTDEATAPAEPTTPVQASRPSTAMPSSQPEAARLSGVPDLHELIARMQALPYLPPEIGTAVIFAPRAPTASGASASMLPEGPHAPTHSAALRLQPVDYVTRISATQLETRQTAATHAPLSPGVAPVPPVRQPPEKAYRADPLAPLHALTEEEKIALFT